MFTLNVISPEGILIDERATTSLVIRTKTGELNILPGHLDMVSVLGDGAMKIDSGKPYIISGGVMEVLADKVTVLADKVKECFMVDIVKNQKRLNEIDKKIMEETLSDMDFKQIMEEKERLETEIRIIREGG